MRSVVRSAVVCLLVALLLAPSGVAQARLYPGPFGPRDVRGDIEAAWLRLGGPGSAVGRPVTDERPLRVGGAFSEFERGSIYWSPRTGAREVRGAVRDTWAAEGWEAGPLGFPITHETGTPVGPGRYNHFQHGSIYYSPQTGAHAVRGAIRDRWAALGWEQSAVGYPTTSERGTPDRVGRYNHFQSGSVYWTPATGAHEVRGSIRTAWAAMGWERSALGYPVTDEYAVPGGRRTDFQGGSLIWAPGHGVAADLVIRGSGNATVPIPKGRMVADTEHDPADGTFHVDTHNGVRAQGALVIESGWQGDGLVNPYVMVDDRLRVTANGPWSIHLRPLASVPTFGPGQTVTGEVNAVRRYVGPPAGMRIEAGGPSFYIALFRLDGTYSDTVWPDPTTRVAYWPVNDGMYVHVRQAAAPWSVSVP